MTRKQVNPGDIQARKALVERKQHYSEWKEQKVNKPYDDNVQKMIDTLVSLEYKFDLYKNPHYSEIEDKLKQAARQLSLAVEIVAGKQAVISSIHRIERHDPHETFSTDGKGGRITVLQSIQSREYMLYRSDIMLINIYGREQQYAIYADKDERGRIFSSNASAFDYMSDEDVQWAKEEAARIWDAAQQYPEFGRQMLNTNYGSNNTR